MQITDGERMIMNERPELIVPGSSQRVVMGDDTSDNYDKNQGSLWRLVPSSEDESRNDIQYFHIQLIYGEKSPRMTMKGTGKNGHVIVTTVDKDGYKNAQKSVWKVFQSSK